MRFVSIVYLMVFCRPMEILRVEAVVGTTSGGLGASLILDFVLVKLIRELSLCLQELSSSSHPPSPSPRETPSPGPTTLDSHTTLSSTRMLFQLE